MDTKTAADKAVTEWLFDGVSDARDKLEAVAAGAPDMDVELREACLLIDKWLLRTGRRLDDE